MTIEGFNRTTIFVSYSHKDREWLDRLRIHLKPLEQTYEVNVWDDTRIKPGSKWKEEIRQAVDRARIAILLISADFLASDFVTTDELPPLLNAAENEGATILPIIVSRCRFTRTESLSKFQAANDPSRPLIGVTKSEQEEVFDSISHSIEASLTSSHTSGPVSEAVSEYQIRSAKLQSNERQEPTTITLPLNMPKFAVTQKPNNDLGYGIKVGGVYKNVSLEVVSSEWAKYSDFSSVKSGWLYAAAHSGLCHAIAFFKLHLYDDGRGYIHILDSSNPVHKIWLTTKTGFRLEETFCWNIDPKVQVFARWEFKWK